MTTILSHRDVASETKIDHNSNMKNILKSKQNNQTGSAKPESKHSISSQKQYKPTLKRSSEKDQIQQSNLLSQKRGIRASIEHNNQLRNIIQNHEEQYKQSKPFQKKYGLPNTTHSKNMQTPPAPQGKQQKQQIKPINAQHKNKTKQSFNKKLTSNIIKDEQVPTSKHSYRIKKVQNRSPKKIRDDLIVLNEEEHKLQMEILQFHKQTKQQLQQYKQMFKFNFNNSKKYFPEMADDQQITLEHFLLQIDDKLKNKRKEMGKIEDKIQHNAYINYLKNQPEDILERQSQEQDQVEELPDNRPRLENNIGSYATGMPNLKDKKHSLNMRRTYDIFKEDDKQSKITSQQIEGRQQQKVKQEGQNRMTINSKLKDFLLS